MKKIAILQSNYVPWKGYFDLIASVDEFVLFDDMQYTRRDWRNRNQIKTPQGAQWLTVPVEVKGRYNQRINETVTDGGHWSALHWKALEQNYRRAPHFDEIAAWLAPLYQASNESELLSVVNRRFLEAICSFLEIKTLISSSSDYELSDEKTERLANICVQAGAEEYISGPAARDYIDESVFTDKGITLRWFDYLGYKVYPQLWGDFVHGVSILDLLFNCGRNSPDYMRYVKT
ncbi:WbqC family protein [Variovorax sp. HJSM1_2]|uniref:WbqC family protein n=1 Tax=Variovorax sp. HJSM1_2 TaxID=3366263 RepID=UPI003BCA4CA9